jgi:hypothetical protein
LPTTAHEKGQPGDGLAFVVSINRFDYGVVAGGVAGVVDGAGVVGSAAGGVAGSAGAVAVGGVAGSAGAVAVGGVVVAGGVAGSLVDVAGAVVVSVVPPLPKTKNAAAPITTISRMTMPQLAPLMPAFWVTLGAAFGRVSRRGSGRWSMV